MATKNIVPRGNNEGQLGTDEKRWNSVIAETASFTTFSGSITALIKFIENKFVKSL